MASEPAGLYIFPYPNSWLRADPHAGRYRDGLLGLDQNKIQKDSPTLPLRPHYFRHPLRLPNPRRNRIIHLTKKTEHALGFFVYFLFFFFRRETMNGFEYFFGFLVFGPIITLPHLFFGRLIPAPCRPSPPPYG